jgi:hypothetical protein
MSIFCLFGCASLEAFRVIDPYSEQSVIMDKFVITLDENKLGDTYSSVQNAIYDDMITFRQYVEGWISSFEESHHDVYEELSTGIICETLSQGNMLSISLGFADEYCFAMFYGVVSIDDEDFSSAMDDKGPFLSQILTQNYKVEDFGLFLYKYAVINNASLYDQLEEFKVDGIGVNYYDKYSQMTGFEKGDISLSQIFVYPNENLAYVDDRIYNNADVVEVLEGHTYLAWDLSDKEDGFELSLFKLAPNPAPWYIIAVVVSAIIVVILLIVCKIKSKAKNSESNVVGENENGK